MIVAGNWKMFKGPLETAEFCRQLTVGLRDAGEGVDVVVCPPFVSLQTAVDELHDTGIAVYAQNAHWLETDPSPARSRRGCSPSSVSPGRSPGTPSGGSTSARPTRRLRVARPTLSTADLGVIACVGESGEERDRGATGDVLRRQVGGDRRRRRGARAPRDRL